VKEGLKMYQKEFTSSKMEADIQTETGKKVMSTQGKGSDHFFFFFILEGEEKKSTLGQISK
jgi:hypothetical protein